MSYTGRMYVRMFLPCGVWLAGGSVAAAVARAAQSMPGSFGMTSLYSNLPAWLFVAGATAALLLGMVQVGRLRFRDRDCYVCGCLLGAERTARGGLGRTRRCLGCGKVHGVNHRLAPHLRPLARAVDEPAPVATSVRSSP
ncbi:hypothetical protein P3W24_08170 [Luteibacter sp. PPL201]|uniref:Uncharacterized protein n=1 Tax=Luteibacter sahnii TaxID=3021977 RepID=A0ABT6B9Z3_9GAMM